MRSTRPNSSRRTQAGYRSRQHCAAVGLLAVGLLGSAAATESAATESAATASEVVNRALRVTLSPETGSLTVVEQLTLQQPRDNLRFVLNTGLELQRAAAPGTAVSVDTTQQAQPPDAASVHQLTLASASTQFTLEYAGTLKVSSAAGGMGNYFDSNGAWLSGTSQWHAQLAGDLRNARSRFAVEVHHRADWQCLSLGRGSQASNGRSQWQEPGPQTDLHLVCTDFKRYEKSWLAADGSREVALQAWLRSADTELAERYLAAAGDYLALYEPLLGNYPYAKFALVENRAPTGFGMPSFTLLGSRVIRLPFILHSSFPHELVHNWFGNGVYIDAAQGNWSEGLTSYLADHALAERRGEGRNYRRKALVRIAVTSARSTPYPLREFRSRGSSSRASMHSAVGYDRSMLLFHMLRTRLGAQTFAAGLHGITARRMFDNASFDDLRSDFEAVSGQDLRGFFAQWLARTDAPMLTLADVSYQDGAVRGTLRQVQPGTAFALDVPIVVSQAGGATRQHIVSMTTREHNFSLVHSEVPLRLDVDPHADLLRALPPAQRPPVLAELFGRPLVALLHPDTPATARPHYRQLATALGAEQVAISTQWHGPQEAAWLLGDGFAGDPRLGATGASWRTSDTDTRPVLVHPDKTVRASAAGAARQEHVASSASGATARDCTLLAARAPTTGKPTGWVGCDDGASALPGLARRVLHYGNRGLLVAAPASAAGGRVHIRAFDWQWPDPGDSELAYKWQPAAPYPAETRPPLLVQH